MKRKKVLRLLAANNWTNKLENMTASHTLKESQTMGCCVF